MTPQERVIATAKAEVGYLEKATNSQLDDKTANAGSNNYTKYARDLDKIGTVYNYPKQGYAWCDIFVDWCFIQTFGLDIAMRMLNQPYKGAGAGATYSAQYFKSAGRFYTRDPQPGDQIFFTATTAGQYSHTGLVVAVDNERVYTVEGNTSGASGVVANGGGVAAKSYSLLYSRIGGYGRPKWELVPDEDDDIDDSGDDVMDYKTFVGYMARYESELADKAASTWAEDSIAKAVKAGALKGDELGRMMAQKGVTRQELAVILDRLGLFE